MPKTSFVPAPQSQLRISVRIAAWFLGSLFIASMALVLNQAMEPEPESVPKQYSVRPK